MTRQAKTMSAAVKLTVFTVVSLVVTGTLVAIMGRFGGGDTQDYNLTDNTLVNSSAVKQVRHNGVPSPGVLGRNSSFPATSA